MSMEQLALRSSICCKAAKKIGAEETTNDEVGLRGVVRKRISNDRSVKGLKQVGQIAKHLGPVRRSQDGQYVFTEGKEKVMRTNRIVPTIFKKIKNKTMI